MRSSGIKSFALAILGGGLFALASCGGGSSDADESQLTVMNSFGTIEGTTNDMSAMEATPVERNTSSAPASNAADNATD